MSKLIEFKSKRNELIFVLFVWFVAMPLWFLAADHVANGFFRQLIINSIFK